MEAHSHVEVDLNGHIVLLLVEIAISLLLLVEEPLVAVLKRHTLRRKTHGRRTCSNSASSLTRMR